jgi:formamidopyrimidine-DNA glycosylase
MLTEAHLANMNNASRPKPTICGDKLKWPTSSCRVSDAQAWFAEVIQDISPRDLEKRLEGRRLVAANRKGKHIWLDFDEGPSLMVHFGMAL